MKTISYASARLSESHGKHTFRDGLSRIRQTWQRLNSTWGKHNSNHLTTEEHNILNAAVRKDDLGAQESIKNHIKPFACESEVVYQKIYECASKPGLYLLYFDTITRVKIIT